MTFRAVPICSLTSEDSLANSLGAPLHLCPLNPSRRVACTNPWPGTVPVTRQVATLSSGRQVIGPPKSDAGNRVVVVPEVIIPALQLHLRWLAQHGEDGLLFTSPEGKLLRYDNFRNRIWYPALLAAELLRVHFHDLRHTGNQLAADAGASLRELMDRMGHSTARAALVYLHGSDERQRAIANAISKRVSGESGPWRPKRSGTQRARKDGRAS